MEKPVQKFSLVVRDVGAADYTSGEEIEVDALSCLRHLPGRRSVWRATYRGEDLVLKVFDQHPKQKRDAAREWENSSFLHGAGVSIPAPLFSAETSDGMLAVGYEFIPEGYTMKEVLVNADEVAREEGYRQLIALHGEQHASGCYQGDDHLGNYIWSGGRLFMLDAGSCVILSAPLGLDERVKNMALFTANIDLPDRRMFDGLVRGYEDALPDEIDRDEFHRKMVPAVQNAIQKRLRSYMRKTRRSSSKLEQIDFPGKSWHACRKMDEEFKGKLLSDPDAFFTDADLLKDGNTCSVVRVCEGGREYVIKRYNQKGLGYRLAHAMVSSRALASWTNGLALVMFGVPTPRPVACLLVKSGGVLRKAYLVMEMLSGVSLRVVEKTQLKDASGHIPAQFAQRWWELDALGATHGDLKASNFILDDEGVLNFIDLDSLTFHQSEQVHEREKKKDFARFLVNWKEDDEIARLFRGVVSGAEVGC